MAAGRKGRTLYLIGIDATPLWILEKLKDEKGMEPFRKLIRLRQLADLESTMPPMSGCSWPSIYTGLTPGEHGAPDFFVMKRDYVKDLVYYDSRHVPPFWKELADSGHRCLVITPCMDILIPDYGNIDMITGFPLKARASNERLKALMHSCGFNGEPELERRMNEGKLTEIEASKEYVKSVRKRIRIAKSLIESGNYDFVFVCFTETDRLQHFTLNKSDWKEYLLPVYREIAGFVGYVEKRVEMENALMLLVSDHGAQPIRLKFLLNAWLIRNGYASLKESVLSGINSTVSRPAPATYEIRERVLKSGLRKIYDRMPHRAKRLTAGIVGNFFSKASSGRYTRLHLFDFDMKKTRAFAEVSNDPVATIWINDKRFEEGTAGDAGRERLKAEISRKLCGLRSAEGDRLIIGTENAGEYYKGTKKFIPADLFVEAKKNYTIDIFNFSTSTYFMKPEKAKSGDHTRHGIIGYYSAGLKLDITGSSVLDIAPTILDYFGRSGAGKGSRLARRRID